MNDDQIGRLIDVLARQAEASERLVGLIESRSLPLLERIALALERAPLAPSGPEGPVRAKASAMVEFRTALKEARWDDAEAVARDLAAEHPGDSGVAALLDMVDRDRQNAAADLRRRIEAARQANDPGGAIASRDALARVIRAEELLDVDRSLVKWLMAQIQRRLRTGTIQPEVVALASRVADSFGGTTEGASLRASLPTLRRSAGLCPRCAEPYTGVDDACPKCLAASPPPPPTSIEMALEPEPEPPAEDEEIREPIDLNDERLWADF